MEVILIDCYRDRMLKSALNFAVGFFGFPIEGKYLQTVTIEEDGVRKSSDVILEWASPCLLL